MSKHSTDSMRSPVMKSTHVNKSSRNTLRGPILSCPVDCQQGIKPKERFVRVLLLDLSPLFDPYDCVLAYALYSY